MNNSTNTLNFLKKRMKTFSNFKKITAEASSRSFYRLYSQKEKSHVAMVYPEENPGEISRISQLTSLFNAQGIHVPQIKEIIDNRIIIQEDIGEISIQNLFLNCNIEEKKKILKIIAIILKKLSEINVSENLPCLNSSRMKQEMDFFITNFIPCLKNLYSDKEKIREQLYLLVSEISNINTFSHRDFHSRNIFYFKDNIFLVDFQDSLIAPEFYDIVSFAFDSYLDLKSLEPFFWETLNDLGIKTDYYQVALTALQRNIKALGTFGYQVRVKNNLSYKKYIKRTIRKIKSNMLFNEFLDETLFSDQLLDL